MDPLELRRLVASVRARVLGRTERTTLGRYVLRGKLGQGGFGTVYRAFDPQTQREVAVKVLRPDRGRRSLRDEARAIAAVESAHVVRVLDYGSDAERDYFVMELVEGQSLRGWLAGDLEKTLLVLDDLLRGVEAIHACGLVHCDLKPENVVIDLHGRAVIMDFGLALPVAALRERSDPVGGSPPYSAPEQFTQAALDARVDQYALGKIGLELLPPESEPRIRAVLRRASAPSPDLRFVSVADFRRALRRPSPLGTAGALTFLVAPILAAVGFAALPAAPTAESSPQEVSARIPNDALRVELLAVDALLEAEHLEAARVALDAIPREVWLEGDASGQADELAMRATLAFQRNDVDGGLDALESAVWVAVEADRYQSAALHATELAARIAQHLGDAEAAARMSSLAWLAVEREGSPPPLVARYWNSVAHVERFLGRPEGELDAAKRAVEALENTADGPSWQELGTLGFAYTSVGDFEGARLNLERALERGADDPSAHAIVAPGLADLEFQQGNVGAAIRMGRAVVEHSVAARGADHPFTVNARAQLGLFLIEHDPPQAVIELRTADALNAKATGIFAQVVRANLGRALAGAGKMEEGETLLLRVLADLDAAGTSPAYDVAFIWGMLGEVREMADRPHLARDAYDQALERLPPDAEMDSLREDLEERRAAVTQTDSAP